MEILKYILFFFLVGCSAPRYYYPVVIAKEGSEITAAVVLKSEIIVFTFIDSTLNEGDSLKFVKGSTPLKVSVQEIYQPYEQYLILP